MEDRLQNKNKSRVSPTNYRPVFVFYWITGPNKLITDTNKNKFYE
jgi:hypothetical protein